MKKFAIILAVGSLGLAACDGNTDSADPVEIVDDVENTTPNDPVAVQPGTEEGSAMTMEVDETDDIGEEATQQEGAPE